MTEVTKKTVKKAAKKKTVDSNQADKLTSNARKPRKTEYKQYAEYSPELVDEILLRISEGESLNKICKEPDMPVRWTFFKWIKSNADIKARYEDALELRAEKFAEELIEISDESYLDTVIDDDGNKRMDAEFVARSKLRVNTRQWVISRLLPKKYGDKIGVSADVRVSDLTDDQLDAQLAMLGVKVSSQDSDD